MAELGNQVDYYISAFYYHIPTINFLAPEVNRLPPDRTSSNPADRSGWQERRRHDCRRRQETFLPPGNALLSKRRI